MQNSRDRLFERLLNSAAPIPIRGKLFPKQGGEFYGEGEIRKETSDFLITLSFRHDGEPPLLELKIITQNDSWKFEGEIDGIRVQTDSLSPMVNRSLTRDWVSREFRAGVIAIEPADSDKMRIGEILELIGTKQPADAEKQMRENEKPSPYSEGVWIQAKIREFPLLHFNGGTEVIEENDFLGKTSRSTADTFSGKSPEIQYGLIQKDGNLSVYLFWKAYVTQDFVLSNYESKLRAFLAGLAFATGQECWPSQVTVRVDGAVISDKVFAIRQTKRTPLAPFSERISFNSRAGKIQWNFESYLNEAYSFFERRTSLSQMALQALWLLRASNAAGTPQQITLMALCVLLESLSSSIFDSLNLEPNSEREQFDDAKREILAWLDANPNLEKIGYSRLRNCIKSAAPLRPADKYRLVCEHFGIKWEGLMFDAWQIWRKTRHQSVHSVLDSETTRSPEDHFNAIGRIAGAINILILKLIGYSGIVSSSVFEDKFSKI